MIKPGKEAKEHFPLLQNSNISYLDNAATTQKPQVVIDAIKEFYCKHNASIHRGVYPLSEQATTMYEKARATVASFINAEPDEIVFTKNGTEACNIVANSMDFFKGPRKDIVLSEMEHHANLIPWQQVAKKFDLNLKFIKMKPDFTLDVDDAERKISSNTAFVAITHVSNALGTINDTKRIIRIAKKHLATTFVDAMQSAPHMQLNVEELGCSFLALSAHKMLGPTGLGVLYGNQIFLEKIPPFQFGGHMIQNVTFEQAQWADAPAKFESGSHHAAGAIGFAKAVKFLQEVGMQNIHDWERKLANRTIEELQKMKEVSLYVPPKEVRSGIVSFNVKGVHPHDVAAVLGERGVCVRGGHHCAMPLMSVLGIEGTVRACFYLYNTEEDVKRLIDGVKEVVRLFA